MPRLWAWISDSKNQKTLGFLGGGLAVAIGAGWTLYQEVFKAEAPSPLRVVENACGVGVGGGDVTISGINCTFGITLSEYEEALARQEEALRSELDAAAGDEARRVALQQNLEEVRKRLDDVQAAFDARSANFAELARALEEGGADTALTERFEMAVASGDSSELEEGLRADLHGSARRTAARAYQLGLLLEQKGQVTEAYEALRQAAELRPEEAAYQEALNRVAGRLDVVLGKGRLRVSAVLTEGGEAVGARHSVYKPEPDLDGNRERVTYNDGAAVWFELTGGTYWIASNADYAGAGREARVAPGRDQEAVVVLNAGRLRMSAVLTDGQKPVSARHSVYHLETDRDGNRERITYRDGGASWFTLPAGTYWVTSASDYASAAREIEVVAGQDTDAVIDLNAGRLRLSAVLAEGQPAVEGRHSVYRPEQDLDGNRQRVTYRDGKASWFTLPAGSYYVTSGADYAGHGQLAEVVAGEDRNEVVDLKAGRLRMSAVLAEGGETVEARHSVYRPEQDLDGNRERITYRDGRASWFTLPAGPYFLRSTTDLAGAERLVEVVAGQDTNAVIPLNAGRLRMEAKGADGTAIDARHSVYRPEKDLDGNRQRVTYRDGKASWFTLPAGTYYVESYSGDLRSHREVKVLPDQTTNLELTLAASP